MKRSALWRAAGGAFACLAAAGAGFWLGCRAAGAEGASAPLLLISLRDRFLACSASQTFAGAEVRVRNDSGKPRGLLIQGPGVDQRTALLSPGDEIALPVALQPGTYRLAGFATAQPGPADLSQWEQVKVVAAPSATQPVSPASTLPSLRLILPDEIPAVVGHEMNLYFDNVLLVPNWRNYLFDVTCAKGTQQEERWTFVPEAGDVGTHPLTLDVVDAEGRRLASAKTTLRVVPADAGAGQEVGLLCIGDSLTHASVYPGEMLALCGEAGNPKLTLLGTHHVEGLPPENRHEGYGGWTYQRFVTHYAPPSDAVDRIKQGSPFMFLVDGKPRYDFARYVQEQCGGKAPGFVTIALGCNDIFGANEEGQEAAIETALGYGDTMIAGIRAAAPEARIGLVMLVPPAASQDAFGANYKCGQTRWQYRRNQHRMVERMKAKYGGREKEGLTLIPAYVNLDTARNYPTQQAPANARSAAKIARLCNGVHPDATGYRQMADSIYAWMKAILAGR